MNGQELAGAFWAECVRPALADLGVVACGAALLGPGSEVLGFDDERSQDHDFGPQLQVFVPPERWGEAVAIADHLDAELPERFEGHPVRFATTADPTSRHRVTVTTVAGFVQELSGLAPASGLSAEDWLRTPTQILASLTEGAVFADPTGALGQARAALAWYSTDVWRYVLACQWHRVAQEEGFLGRTGERGDDLGSRLIAARLARDVMRLGFLVERRWAPYAKWFGTAFGRLDCAADVVPHLDRLVASSSWPARQDAYLAAGVALAERCNGLGLTDPVDPAPRPFHDRPYRVLGADRYAEALLSGSPMRALGWRGAIDQWVDNTDVLRIAP